MGPQKAGEWAYILTGWARWSGVCQAGVGERALGLGGARPPNPQPLPFLFVVLEG